MVKKLIGSVLVLITISIAHLVGQQFKQFSGKPETFLAEVKSFMGSNQDDEIVKNLKEFSVNWDSSRISQEEKEKILIICKSLVDKKARFNPDVNYFLKSINIFVTSKHSTASFDEWLNALKTYGDNKKITLSSYNRIIVSAYKLLKENIILESPSLKWKPTSKDYY